MSNEFEKYPVLTEHIREYASFGHFSNWSSFLAELNQALVKENPPPPASAEEEAARMYPDLAGEPYDLINKVQQEKRQAHITCARMYTGEIETLKAENSKMRQALEEISGTVFNISDRATAMTMKSIATEALKTP